MLILSSLPLFWHFKVFWWEQSSLAGPRAHSASCSFGYLGSEPAQSTAGDPEGSHYEESKKPLPGLSLLPLGTDFYLCMCSAVHPAEVDQSSTWLPSQFSLSLAHFLQPSWSVGALSSLATSGWTTHFLGILKLHRRRTQQKPHSYHHEACFKSHSEPIPRLGARGFLLPHCLPPHCDKPHSNGDLPGHPRREISPKKGDN